MDQIGIGLAGLGTVGAGVYKHLIRNRAIITERVGLELAVRRIAVRDQKKCRPVQPPAEIITGHWEELIEDPEISILVELMGGIDAPYEFTMRALEAGKVVVTGKKALRKASRSSSKRPLRVEFRSSNRSGKVLSEITLRPFTAS